MDFSSYDSLFLVWKQTQAALKKAKIITDSNVFVDRGILDEQEQIEESKRSQRKFKKTGDLEINNDVLSASEEGIMISCRISIGDGENQHESRLNMHNLLKLGTKGLGKHLKQHLSQWLEIEGVDAQVETEKTERIFLLIIYNIQQ